MDKHTPLYERQKALGARFTSFGGWELPVSYTDIIKEHLAVRETAGLFDVSHMGEIQVTGKDALEFVSRLVTNEVVSTAPGKAVYTPVCKEDGTVVDDILVYKKSDTDLFLVVNAGNIDKDYEWFLQKAAEMALVDVKIKNLSPFYVQLAVQGPNAETLLKRLVPEGIELPAFFRFIETHVLGLPVLLSRTGYTGEDGFEIYLFAEQNSEAPERLWNGILEKGSDLGIVPVGLGARDTLRLEACLPLYGHELSDTITPLEAGLDRFVKLGKNAFIGKEALDAQKQGGIKKQIYGIELVGRGIPRNGYEVFKNGTKLGYITSGSFCPKLNKNVGLALLNNPSGGLLTEGEEINVRIREKDVPAKITAVPFYSKKYKK